MRTRLIVRKLQRLLFDEAGRYVTKDVAVEAIDNEQKRLCRDLYALKFIGSLTLKQGQGQYEGFGGLYRVNEILAPATWSLRPAFITDPKRWSEIKKANFGFAYPIFFFSYNRILNVFPVPTTDGDEVEIIGYALPDQDLTFDGDPELNEDWDDALLYGAALTLFAEPNIKKNAAGFDPQEITQMYNDARDSASTTKETAGSPEIVRHSSENLGF